MWRSWTRRILRYVEPSIVLWRLAIDSSVLRELALSVPSILKALSHSGRCASYASMFVSIDGIANITRIFRWMTVDGSYLSSGLSRG